MPHHNFSPDMHAMLCDGWRFLEELAQSGKSTKAQREQAEKKRKAIETTIDLLVAKKELSDAERLLLRNELRYIMSRIVAYPPIDFSGMCYRTFPVNPIKRSVKQVNLRLDILQNGGGVDAISPLALRKILALLESDIVVLENASKQGEKLGGDKYDQVYQIAKETLVQIKTRLAEPREE